MYEEASLKKIGQKQFPRVSFVEGQGRKSPLQCQLKADRDGRHLREDVCNYQILFIKCISLILKIDFSTTSAIKCIYNINYNI